MRNLTTLAVLALAFLLPSCGGSAADKREAAGKESVELMEKLASTLETVKDEATAKAAAPKLDQTIQRIFDLKKEMDAMEKPSQADQDAMKSKYNDRLQAAMTKLMQAMGRIGSDEKIQAILEPVMKKFEQMGK